MHSHSSAAVFGGKMYRQVDGFRIVRKWRVFMLSDVLGDFRPVGTYPGENASHDELNMDPCVVWRANYEEARRRRSEQAQIAIAQLVERN